MGHRFLSNKKIEIPVADDYEIILEENFVIADQDKRREMIRQQITELAREEGGEIRLPNWPGKKAERLKLRRICWKKSIIW